MCGLMEQESIEIVYNRSDHCRNGFFWRKDETDFMRVKNLEIAFVEKWFLSLEVALNFKLEPFLLMTDRQYMVPLKDTVFLP